MSVEKEQFEKVMGELRRACLPAGAADVIQAYVDAHGAALARVEASAATLAAAGRAAYAERNTFRELLDDAGELLSHFKDGEPYEHEREDLPGRVDEYLERLDAFRDQDEQQENPADSWMPPWWDEMAAAFKARQEAQGAQAGDELDVAAEAIFNADKENWLSAGPYPQLHANDKARLRAMASAALAAQPVLVSGSALLRSLIEGIDHVEEEDFPAWAREVEAAYRAALATQPAVPGEYPAGAIENGRTLLDRLEQCYGFRDAQGHLLANCAEWLEARLCFEHLVGLILTRPGVEVFGWYWKRRFRGEVVNSGVSVGSRKPELGEETFGKHRTSTEYIALAIVEPAPAAEKAR